MEEDIKNIHKEMTFVEEHLKGTHTFLNKCIRRWRQKRFNVKVSCGGKLLYYIKVYVHVHVCSLSLSLFIALYFSSVVSFTFYYFNFIMILLSGIIVILFLCRIIKKHTC